MFTEQDIKRIAYNVILGGTAPTAGDSFEATSSTILGFVGRILKAYRTADGTANTGTTLADDSVLTVTLAASTNYQYELFGFSTNAGAAEGIKVALSGTVGVTSMKAQISIFDDTLNTLVGFARVTALGSAVGAGLSSGVNYFEIKGCIETSTAGTLLLQAAQNAAGAGAGVTVQRGTSLVALRVS